VLEHGREPVTDTVQRIRIEKPFDDQEAVTPVLLDLRAGRLVHRPNANGRGQ
jgi:hypothetical protein